MLKACEWCGSEMKVTPSRLKAGGGRFCSRSCKSSGQCHLRGRGPLAKVTKEDLAPIWARREINIATMAKALGVSRAAVSWHAKKLGLPSRAGNQECNKGCSDAEFVSMWMAGLHGSEITRICGYSCRNSVAIRRVNLGLPTRGRSSGTGRHGGWKTITYREYAEIKLARMMKDAV